MKKLLTLLLCFMALFASMAPVYSDEHEHSFTVEIKVQDATCTSKPIYQHKCEFCEEMDGISYTKPEDNTLPHNYVEVEDDAYLAGGGTDCQTPFIYYKSCSECHAKSVETFTGSKCGEHKFTEKSNTYVVTEATHFAPAEYYYTCSVCHTKGENTYKDGDPIAHTFDQEVVKEEYLSSPATCTQQAVYYKSCTCGAKGTETFTYGELKPHTYDQSIPDATKYLKSEATCTQQAVYYKSCTCGAKGTETFTYGDLKPHTFDQEVPTNTYLKTPATCTQQAVYYKSCTCGAKGTETFTYGELKPHNFTKKTTTNDYLKTPATCTASAVYYYCCTDCSAKGTTIYSSGNPLPHTYTRKVVTDTYKKSNATCTSPAIYYYCCENCDSKGTTTYENGNALGHDFSSKITVSNKYLKSNADCTSPAVYYYACSRCGEIGTTTFTNGSALGHSYGAWVSVDEHKHAHTCTRCGGTETENHKWNDGKVIKKATQTEEGEIEYTCKLCGEKKREIIKPVDIYGIEIPKIDIESREYIYTGSEIEFGVPDSDFYTTSNNIQIDAGEYEVIVSLNENDYKWEDGTKDDLKYTFIIQKASYDMSNVVFLDKAVFYDGNSYSLYAENVPDGLTLTYNISDVSEPGDYEIIASYDGDENHNPIDSISAYLYILDKPVNQNSISNGYYTIVGNIPDGVGLLTHTLSSDDEKYTAAKNAIINNFDVDEKNILQVIDLDLIYNNLLVNYDGSLTITMDGPNDSKYDLYHIHNGVCEKVDYEEDEGKIIFTLNSFSQIAFVHVDMTLTYLMYGGIAAAILALLIFIIVKITKSIKKKKALLAAKKAEEEANKVEEEVAEEVVEEQPTQEEVEEEVVEEPKKVKKESFFARLLSFFRRKPKEVKQEEIVEEETDIDENIEVSSNEEVVEEQSLQEETVEEVVDEQPQEELVIQEEVIEEETPIEESSENTEEESIKEKIIEIEIPKQKKVEEEVVEEVIEKEKKESLFKRLFKKKEKVVEKTAEERLKEIRESKTSSIYKIEDISDDEEN